MAELHLDRHEAELGYLPPVCMRCAAPAVCQRQHEFKKSGASQETKSWVIAPLCAAHKNHWLVRGLAVPLALVAWLVLSCAGLISAGRDYAGTAMLGSAAVFVLWIVLAAVLHYTSIHASQISASALVLRGVAPEFIEALEQHRRSPQGKQLVTIEGAALARNQIRLTRAEIEGGLPAVCICCDTPAIDWRERAYRVPENPGLSVLTLTTVGMLSALVLGVGWISYRKGPQLRVRVPLCHRHRNHWSRKPLLIIGSGLLLAAIFAGAFQLVPREGAGWVCLAVLVAGIVWCIVAISLIESGVKPMEIRPEALTLKGVSEGFVRAVERQRRQG